MRKRSDDPPTEAQAGKPEQADSNPFAALRQLTGGYVLSRCLHVIAELGVADFLNDAPQTAEKLASLVSVQAEALERMMSLLASHGVFEAHAGTFSHSAASRLLRSDHPQSMRPFVRIFGSRYNWASYELLDHSLKTGLPAADKLFPEGRWAYLSTHPEDAALFNAAMTAKAQQQIPAIVASYDFSGFEVVGDIGGGVGHLLSAILVSTPTVKGILFDLPHVIDRVKALASDRLIVQAGNFFEDPIPHCDAYILMEVIHDWDDPHSIAILKAIRQAAPAHAKLLLIEQLLPDDPGPDWSRILDIHMMALLGGKQRTQQQYAALLEAAGFSIERKLDLNPGLSIIEAVPA